MKLSDCNLWQNSLANPEMGRPLEDPDQKNKEKIKEKIEIKGTGQPEAHRLYLLIIS